MSILFWLLLSILVWFFLEVWAVGVVALGRVHKVSIGGDLEF